MGMSKLNIWIRDTVHPLLPYQSTAHSYRAVILSCETPPTPLDYGAVSGGVFPLTDPGPAGGKIHGEVEVPPGTYLVRAWATCKNVWTSWAWVQAPAGKMVSVNLITNRFRECLSEARVVAILAAWCAHHGIPFRPGCPPADIPPDVLERAAEAMQNVEKHLEEPYEGYDEGLIQAFEEMKELAERSEKGEA